jgi:hypothetical protein
MGAADAAPRNPANSLLCRADGAHLSSTVRALMLAISDHITMLVRPSEKTANRLVSVCH